MENAKFQFARQVQNMATTIAGVEHTLNDLSAVYNARLYGPGASDAFNDEELGALETAGGRKMTADDIYAFIIFCDQFHTFFHNGVAAQRDYAANVNQIRTDL